MISLSDTSGRAAKLTRFFHDVSNGNRVVSSKKDAELFQEAVRVQPSASACLETLIARTGGLNAIRFCVRAELSSAFIQSHTLKFIGYFSDPAVKTLNNGQLLNQLLVTIADPPTLWNTLLKLFLKHEIVAGGLQSFAWLTYELVSLPSNAGLDFLKDAKAIFDDGSILRSESHETRNLGYKIQKILQMKFTPSQSSDQSESPGGRHDNDFANFREVAIYPTTDEFLSKEKPFYRKSHEVFEADAEERARVHLDNQFRLLREDMLAELRNEQQVATGRKQGRRSAFCLGGFFPVGINLGEEHRRRKCSLALECFSGLGSLKSKSADGRKRFLEDDKTFVKHQAFGILCRGSTIYGFAYIERDIRLLCRDPPVICLRFTDNQSLGRALSALKTPQDIQFVHVDTPVFAYEPVLIGLKDILDLPLQGFLLNHQSCAGNFLPNPKLGLLASRYRAVLAANPEASALEIGAYTLNRSQLESVANAFASAIALIQGPPGEYAHRFIEIVQLIDTNNTTGTGKSFTGSLIAKLIHQQTNLRMLVLSYTNHALDQFTEELQDAGIPNEDMVRLGSKSTQKTEPLLLSRQRTNHRRSNNWHSILCAKKERQGFAATEMEIALRQYSGFVLSFDVLLEYLEFSDDADKHFYDAFLVPTQDKQWKKVGKRGREVKPDYLFSRWKDGEDAGIFGGFISPSVNHVWKMERATRLAQLTRWTHLLVAERVETVQEQARQFDYVQDQIDEIFNESKVAVLESKRVIASTTTAAAMYNKLIRAAKPDIVIVEEAGEILESHVLTAMAPTVKQLVLIGDHKQLRPKVNNYALTVEKGDGFDLNMSLFERLIRQGHPHSTLISQHRMHPDISVYPRTLIYDNPRLEDDPKTRSRPRIEGFQGRHVVFVNHSKPEANFDRATDRRDPSSKSSKQNDFEAEMVLKCVKYLAQQGYGTDRIVVLTPYLGQLRLLRETLSKETDPWLNDLDAYDLVRAGLMTQSAAKIARKPLRLSTIGKALPFVK
jgi:hypothetical protein